MRGLLSKDLCGASFDSKSFTEFNMVLNMKKNTCWHVSFLIFLKEGARGGLIIYFLINRGRHEG